MTKQEIETAIENGESIWVAQGRKVLELCPDMSVKINNSDRPDVAMTTFEVDNGGIVIKRKTQWTDLFFYYEDISKNKAAAEHYAFHKNVTRTETLPFLTWEEFLEEIELKFIACDGVSNMTLYYCDNTIYLVDDEYPEFNTTSWELTEENFYKAYDECVRLFKGGEQI